MRRAAVARSSTPAAPCARVLLMATLSHPPIAPAAHVAPSHARAQSRLTASSPQQCDIARAAGRARRPLAPLVAPQACTRCLNPTLQCYTRRTHAERLPAPRTVATSPCFWEAELTNCNQCGGTKRNRSRARRAFALH
eukprot:871228-Pyramimonas_sp.AAC.1